VARKAPKKPAERPPVGITRRPPVAAIAGSSGLLVLGALAFWLWSRGPQFALEPDANRNILLITVDTLRADALGAYGGRAATPNIDALANRGARFEFAHAHAVVTLPSHTSILTGRLPYEHGMRDNSGFRVPDGTETLATRLRPKGFATGAFVAGFPLTKRFGLTPGFDLYDDLLPEMGTATAHSMPDRPADVVVSRTIDWIGKQSGKFFAWVHLFDPHSPYKPPEDLRARYSDQPYFGEVAFVDRALGPLVERLRALDRPTLVIVTADHGESLGDHGELTHGMFAYEATLRVPLIMAVVGGKGGGGGARGAVIDAPVRHVDLAPTLLESAGEPIPDGLAGASLRPLLAGGAAPDRPNYFESMTYNLVRGWAPLRGVIVGREKYIDLPIAELYDLAADPGEARNLAAGPGDRMKVLANVLRGFNTAPPKRPGREAADVAATLRSLGYITGSAPARTSYTEADDPKRLVEIDRDLHNATEHFQQGRIREAVALFSSVIARRVDTVDAYIQLSYVYYESGQMEQAIATLEQALQNGVPDRDVRIRLGLYLAETRVDTKRAIKLLEGLPDTDAEALNSLGVAYGAAGRYADAIGAFRRILSLDATNGLALQNIATMYLHDAEARPAGKAERLKQAEAHARQAIAVDPALAKAHTTLGVALFRQGQAADAIEEWKRAVTLDAAEFDALYNLWQELARAGRHDEARTYGEQYVRTAPPYLREEIARIRAYLQGKH
jgi:arylsulfatase A-like enzyme/Flp pilus assembly protein TadD